MPFTIPLTPKQHAAIAQLQAQADAATKAVAVYTAAVIDSNSEAPAAFQGMTLTDDGLVLGDAPATTQEP